MIVQLYTLTQINLTALIYTLILPPSVAPTRPQKRGECFCSRNSFCDWIWLIARRLPLFLFNTVTIKALNSNTIVVHFTEIYIALLFPVPCLSDKSMGINHKTNPPAAQSSSSAPFSQSFSPSHLHESETHLLVAPPQSNFSGGHVCLPVAERKINRWELRSVQTVYGPNDGSYNLTYNYLVWFGS